MIMMIVINVIFRVKVANKYHVNFAHKVDVHHVKTDII